MAELLIKMGDGFPHKDRMMSMGGAAHEAEAKASWIEFTASQSRYANLIGTDAKITAATAKYEEAKYSCFREGDIIKVRPDGWSWGKRESYPRFKIIRIADSALELLGYRFSGRKGQLHIPELIEQLWQEDEKRLVVEYDELSRRDISHLAPRVYHMRKLWIPDMRGLNEGRITEILASRIEARQQKYTDFDAAKALVHGSAGVFDIKSAGGDYTDISDWDAGEACDLTAGGGQGLSVAECYDDWPGGLDDAIDLAADWTADVDNYPVIRAHSGARHTGTAESGFFIDSSHTGNLIIIRCAYALVQYIETQSPSQDNNVSIYYLTNSSYILTVENCIHHNTPGGVSTLVIYGSNSSFIKNCCFYDSGDEHYFRHGTYFNCVAYAIGDWGYDEEIIFWDCYTYDCVVYNSNSGVGYDDYYSPDGGDYNAGSDASAPGANSIDNQGLADYDWVNTGAGTEDFHIQTTSTLKGAGFDYTGSGQLATDVDGDAWADPPSIGWDEFVAAGPTVKPAWYYEKMRKAQ